MFGKSYILDHCADYCKRVTEQEAYQAYVTDALRLVTHNTAQFAKEGKALKYRFTEIIHPAKQQDIENASEKAQEIKSRIIERLKKFEKGG